MAVVFALHNFNYRGRGAFEDVDSVIVPSRFAASYYRRALGHEFHDLLKSARERQAAGDVEAAVAIYEEILRREPKHVGALHGLGIALNRRGDRASAHL